MKRSCFHGRRAVAAFAVAALLGTARARAEDAISEEARLYFQNGVELVQADPPNYQDAYYQFKLAWEKSKSWKVLSNFGLCALKLERDGEAIWAYTEYLKQNDVDPAERKDLERDLLLLNGNAAAVSLSSDVGDLEVVDARVGSAVPPQTYRFENGKLELRLRAGSHAITASSQGKSQRWDVTLSPGRTDQHRFEFGPAPAAPAAAPLFKLAAAPAPAAMSAAPQQRSGRSGAVRSVGYVATGVGLLALGGGAFLGLSAKSGESSARKQCVETSEFGLLCPESSRGDFDSARQKAQLANGFLIGGGVVAAAGLVMIIVGGPKPAEQASLQLAPALGARSAGLLAGGSF